MFDPSDGISISLRREQWQQVIEAMGYAPFRLAAPLIQEVIRQLNNPLQRQFSPAKAPQQLRPEMVQPDQPKSA